MRPHLGDAPADQAGLLFYSYVRDLLSFRRAVREAQSADPILGSTDPDPCTAGR